MSKRLLLTVVIAAAPLVGCGGFKEAMTAHVDVVARAGSQELTVNRLAELLGTARVPIPLTRENARVVAEFWSNYQLLGAAAARGDSLSDPKLMDEALWPLISQARAEKFHDALAKVWAGGDTASEARYLQGDLLAARHILLRAPQGGQPGQ